MKKIIVAGLAALVLFCCVGMLAVLGGGVTAQAAQKQDCDPPGEGTGSVSGPARLPVTGAYVVTSDYGWRVNPGDKYRGRYMLHAGIDMAESGGEGPIVAAMGGTVRKVFVDQIGTHIVEIDVGGGVVMEYMHLSGFAKGLSAGDKVWPGKQLGIEGMTGNASGPHLHFQVNVAGKPVDPRPWMAKQKVTIPKLTGVGTAPPPVTSPPSSSPTSTPSSSPAVGGGPSNIAQGEAISASPVAGKLPNKVGPYQGKQILNAAYIIKSGQALKLDAWSITVGVMTAMGESSLNNISHGDKAGPDSAGLFQQRGNGAWGSYADRTNPSIASKNFYKALMKVPGYHKMTPTHAAHAVQGNQDPEHYAANWADAVTMIATLTKDPGLLKKLPVYGPTDGDKNACDSNGSGPTGSGNAIVAAAKKQLGVPYSWGGGNYKGPTLGIASVGGDGSHTIGFDCSGLVMYAVYQGADVKLTHSADDDAFTTKGTPVPRDFSVMEAGDVISVSEDGSGARGSYGHVMIYEGGGRAIDAPSPGKVVHEFDLKNSAYFKPMKWSIRRFVTPSGATKTAQAQ